MVFHNKQVFRPFQLTHPEATGDKKLREAELVFHQLAKPLIDEFKQVMVSL